MELLKIVHKHFTLSLTCPKYLEVWRRADQFVGGTNLTSTYYWSEEVKSVTMYIEDGKEIDIKPQEKSERAIFFDHTDYPIWVEFDKEVTNARFASILQSDNERFSYHTSHRILAGFINFSNDIGRSEIKLKYDREGREHTFIFGFDVLSTKLNYHEHWRSIIADIEAEYSMLSLDYMRRTFHSFSPDSSGERSDLVWWSIFQGQQKKFITAIKHIIERPRHRLRSQTTYQRLDKIKRIPNTLENEIAEHRHNERWLYRVEEQVHSNDTQENRFLKFALSEISKKYDALKRKIEKRENTSETFLEEINETKRVMQTLQRHPFFRSVGQFKGFSQESLVLQKATGYTDVYRTWALLRRAYSLNEGLFRLQSKDIATLYEIWCFIEVSHIVREQLGISNEDVDHQNRMEMGGLFTWDMGKGEHSRILFRKDGIELAELVYNPKHTEQENSTSSIGNFVVRTVAQKPDIVLQLVKDDIQNGMKMTYLFDAKYRIDSNRSGVDYPPDDAINQMHRYRDAIYYQQEQGVPLKKEVVGGYILFPGSGESLDVQTATFYKSINEVNIGAFPLRPKDEENRKLLSKFISSLITNEGQSLIAGAIPQKGLNYIIDSIGTDSNMAFVGYVKAPTAESSDKFKEYFFRFKNNDHPSFYYSGSSISKSIDLRTIRYLFTNLPGDGYYRVKRIYTERRNNLFWDKKEQEDKSMRVIFELGEFVPLEGEPISFSYSGVKALKVHKDGQVMPLHQIKEAFALLQPKPDETTIG